MDDRVVWNNQESFRVAVRRGRSSFPDFSPLRFEADFAMASSLLGVVIITVLLLVLIGVVGQILFGDEQG